MKNAFFFTWVSEQTNSFNFYLRLTINVIQIKENKKSITYSANAAKTVTPYFSAFEIRQVKIVN